MSVPRLDFLGVAYPPGVAIPLCTFALVGYFLFWLELTTLFTRHEPEGIEHSPYGFNGAVEALVLPLIGTACGKSKVMWSLFSDLTLCALISFCSTTIDTSTATRKTIPRIGPPESMVPVGSVAGGLSGFSDPVRLLRATAFHQLAFPFRFTSIAIYVFLLQWTTRTIPRPSGLGRETWLASIRECPMLGP